MRAGAVGIGALQANTVPVVAVPLLEANVVEESFGGQRFSAPHDEGTQESRVLLFPEGASTTSVSPLGRPGAFVLDVGRLLLGVAIGGSGRCRVAVGSTVTVGGRSTGTIAVVVSLRRVVPGNAILDLLVTKGWMVTSIALRWASGMLLEASVSCGISIERT